MKSHGIQVMKRVTIEVDFINFDKLDVKIARILKNLKIQIEDNALPYLSDNDYSVSLDYVKETHFEEREINGEVCKVYKQRKTT